MLLVAVLACCCLILIPDLLRFMVIPAALPPLIAAKDFSLRLASFL